MKTPSPEKKNPPRINNNNNQNSNSNSNERGNFKKNNNRNFRHRPKGPNQESKDQPLKNNPPQNIEKTYEKYLNLLEQHLLARKKFHDLFYRADFAQRNKCERNFYNTLNDIQEFLKKLDFSTRENFEKRNNGLKEDKTYSQNHQLIDDPKKEDRQLSNGPENNITDPHLLQSQKQKNYSLDKEESIGSAEDYLKYKGQSA